MVSSQSGWDSSQFYICSLKMDGFFSQHSRACSQNGRMSFQNLWVCLGFQSKSNWMTFLSTCMGFRSTFMCFALNMEWGPVRLLFLNGSSMGDGFLLRNGAELRAYSFCTQLCCSRSPHPKQIEYSGSLPDCLIIAAWGYMWLV